MPARLIRPVLIALALFAADAASMAAAAPGAHGIAIRGAPELAPDFDHLPYADPDAKKGGKLTLGFLGAFDSLNPFNLKAGSTAQGLNANVFQTLMMRSLDEPFTLYGLIAQTIETDEARSFAIFHLNPLARFSDGSPITAEDVAFTFKLLKEQGRPQQRAAFSRVKSVTTPDALTVRYDFPDVDDREMPLTLGLMPVLSRAHTDVAHFAEASLAAPVGSGPYIVSEVVPGQKLVLTRNPDYWARELPVHRGMFNFDTIEILYFRDVTTLFEAFPGGLVDYREETNPTRWVTGYDFPAIRDGAKIKAQAPLGGPKGMEGFAFNTRRPIFADVRLREALGEMFDFEWLNANVFDHLYARADSYFADSELASAGRPATARERALLAPFPGAVRADILEGAWRPPVSDGSGRDRATARRALDLLAQAGWRIEANQLRKNGYPLAFEIMVQDRNQERLALNFSDSLRRIGVEATVKLVDEVQYQRRRQKFDFDMMLGTWTASASPGNEQRSRWSSASADQEASFNLSGARSLAVDALIEAMLAARTQDDFIAAVRAYDRVLLSGFYIVPLYYRRDQWFAASSDLARPARLARYAAPLFGATLDTWWRKSP